MDIYYSQHVFPLIYMQKESEWIQEIAEGAQIKTEKVEALVKDFTYNPNLKNIGVRIQPFVPIFKNYLALSPTLIDVSLIEGNYLDLQCKINKLTYDKLSFQKEKLLISEIKHNLINKKDFYIRSNIKVIIDSNTLTDIDLVLIEKKTNSLILLEIKWPLRPKSEFDLFKKDEEIEKGISQAKLSSEFVKKNLKAFVKNYFPDYKNRKIEHIFSFVVSRDNIGTTAQHSYEFPVVDYEVFKIYLYNHVSFFDMYPKISKREWLPEQNLNFTINDFALKIKKYKFTLPAISHLDEKDNYNEIFKNHIENLGLIKKFSVEISSKRHLSSEKVAESDLYYQKGLYSSNSGDLPNAIEYYKKSISEYPNIEAQNNLGSIYIQTGEFKKAEDALLEGHKNNPDCEEVNINLALLKTGQGDEEKNHDRNALYQKAIFHVKSAIKINPFNFHSLYILGYLYDRVGNVNRSIYYLNKSTNINNDFLDSHINLMPLYRYKGNMRKYLIEMEHIARICPNFPRIKYALAGLYVRLNIFSDKSLSIIKKALHDEPDSEEIWTYLLSTLSRLGNKYQDEYINSIKIFLKKFPNSSKKKCT